MLQLVRAPDQRGSWSPEEVAHALNSRRGEFCGVLSRRRDGASVSAETRQEVVDEAISLVVMSRKPVRNEQHLEGAFWTTVRFLLVEHRSGRHSVRVGSRQRVSLDLVAGQLPNGIEPSEFIEARERIARAADFMAQLNPFEQQVVTLMATLGVGVKLAARRLGVPTKTVIAAARSADQKLDQVAVIAAAGRMCEYRHRAIVAHAEGTAQAQEQAAARAHLAACAGCRSAYVQLVRQMRDRGFQRRASAVFVPLPMLAAHSHGRWAERLVAFIADRRLPSASGSGERTVGLLGGGGVAAKAAVAGTAAVIAGAGVVGLTAGVRSVSPHPPRHRQHVQKTHPETAVIAAVPPVASAHALSRAASVSRAGRRPSPGARGLTSYPSREVKAAVTDFPGLGANAPQRPATTSHIETSQPRMLTERERVLKTP